MPRSLPEALSTAAQQHCGKPNDGGQQKEQHQEAGPESDLDVGQRPAREIIVHPTRLSLPGGP